jgi:DNA-binding FrmR family transcriptional regulator
MYPLLEDSMAAKHGSHPGIIARLKRAQGHLAGVLAMFESGRPCVELAQQLHAVESAIGTAKRELIHDHIENCLEADGDGTDSRTALKELKLLAKYL